MPSQDHNSSSGSRRDFLKRSGAVGVGAVGLWAAPTVSAVAGPLEGSSGSVADSTTYCFIGFQRNSAPDALSPIFYGSPTYSPQWIDPATNAPAFVPASPVESGFYDGVPLDTDCMNKQSGALSQEVDAPTNTYSAEFTNADSVGTGPDLRVEYVFDSKTYTDASQMEASPIGRPGDVRAWALNGYRIKHAYGWTPPSIPGFDGSWYTIPVVGATTIELTNKYTYAVELILVPPATTP